MEREMICIVCPKGCHLKVMVDEVSKAVNVEGYSCDRGKNYGKTEIVAPMRVITSTVQFEGKDHQRLPVKTHKPIPKALIGKCMEEINKVSVKPPVQMYDVLIENIADSGANLIATRSQWT